MLHLFKETTIQRQIDMNITFYLIFLLTEESFAYLNIFIEEESKTFKTL